MNRYLDRSLIKIIILIIFIILVFGLNKYLTKTTKSENINIGKELELVFFGLGDADSILIRQEDKVLLIDTGEGKHGVFIEKSLSDLGIEKIDYLILTHPDKDHIGAATHLISKFEVGTIYQSTFQKGKDDQIKLNNIINNKNIDNLFLKEIHEFSMENIKVKIFPPEKEEYKQSNNYSLVTLLTYGDLSYLFGGDAEKKRLEEIIKYDLPKITLYKVPHHGRDNSISSNIIKIISPQVAVVTNYSTEPIVLQALKRENTKVYYTGDKTIRFISDGIELKEKPN